MSGGLVAVTGAAGRLGSILRPALAEAGYRATLTDSHPIKGLLASETFQRARLTDAARLRRAFRGAQALIHLGGHALEGEWDALIEANVSGLVCTLEAARAEGLGRIVFAGTLHAVGMHPRSHPIDEDSLPAPDSRYGVTKVFGEAACRMMAEKYGLTVIALRLGHVVGTMDHAAPGQGIAAEDLTRLILLVLTIDEPGFHLFHAVAPHPDYPLSDGRLQRRFGFEYRHTGPARDEVFRRVSQEAGLDDLGRERHGGWFANRR